MPYKKHFQQPEQRYLKQSRPTHTPRIRCCALNGAEQQVLAGVPLAACVRQLK
jgi:hypothetical protein